MRWLYHVVRKEDAPPEGAASYGAASLATEGFLHASYRDAVTESARLYFPAGAELVVLRIDPRRVGCVIEEAATPRGPMPHVFGPIPKDAIAARLSLTEMNDAALAPDRVQNTRIAFVAFEGMTLLDLVSVLDGVRRLKTMGFDETLSCEVVSATESTRIHDECNMHVTCDAARPPLDAFDAIVIAGGPGTRTLQDDPAVIRWLSGFPENRLAASVCTGSLLLGAAGRLRGKRATTHLTAKDDLAKYGATFVDAHVVDEGSVITAGGVTSGIHLGLHLVMRFEGRIARDRIAAQMHADGAAT